MSVQRQLLEDMQFDPTKYSIPQIQQGVQNGVIPPYIGIPLINEIVRQKQMAQMSQQAQQPAQQPPVAQQVLAQAQQVQGIDNLPSNLPAQGYAPGGIVAFDDGGEVKRFQGTSGSLVGGDRDKEEEPSGFPKYAPYRMVGRPESTWRVDRAGTDVADFFRWLDRVARPYAYRTGKESTTTPNTAGANPNAPRPSAEQAAEFFGEPSPTVPSPPGQEFGPPKPSATTTPAVVRPRADAGIAALGKPVAPGEFKPPAGPSATQSATEALYGSADGAPGLVGHYANIAAEAERKRAEAAGKVKGKAFEGYEEALRKEAGQFADQRKEDAYMALVKAGLGMIAGSAPGKTAAQAISEGGMRGIESFESANRDLQKAARENRKELASIEQARRAESIGDRDKEQAYIETAAKSKREMYAHVTDALMKATDLDRKEAAAIAERTFVTAADWNKTLLQGQIQASIHAADRAAQAGNVDKQIAAQLRITELRIGLLMENAKAQGARATTMMQRERLKAAEQFNSSPEGIAAIKELKAKPGDPLAEGKYNTARNNYILNVLGNMQGGGIDTLPSGVRRSEDLLWSE